MAYIKNNGQQLACKVVDLRAMRERATKEIEEQKLKFFRNKWQASMVKSDGGERCLLYTSDAADDTAVV